MAQSVMYHEGNRQLQDRFDSRRISDRLEEKLMRTEFSADDKRFMESLPYFFLATSLALNGRAAEAREARNAGLRLDPNFTIARFRNERRSENPTFLAQRERIYEGLSLAGLPEDKLT